MELGAPSWWLVQSGSDTPLIFEVKAIEQIHFLLKPALRHVLNTLIQSSYPLLSRSAGTFLERLDEIWLLISGMLEAYYLKTWKASFAEHFYGLKRKIPDTTDWSPWKQLPMRGLDRAWILLVMIPYLKEKCDNYFDTWKRQERTAMLFGNDVNKSSLQKIIGLLKRLFIKLYPYALRLIHLANLMQTLRYVYGYSRNPSLGYFLSGHSLVRLNAQDFHSFERRKRVRSREWSMSRKNGSMFRSLRMLVQNGSSFVFETFKTGLPLIIMGYQLFEGWSASEAVQRSSHGPIPPPPLPLPKAPNGISLPTDSSKCPLCLSVIDIPTLIPSGYVFCYACILDHLRSNSFKCPVTKISVREQQLIRLYIE